MYNIVTELRYSSCILMLTVSGRKDHSNHIIRPSVDGQVILYAINILNCTKTINKKFEDFIQHLKLLLGSLAGALK